ncbi:hypothetical protein E2C01_092296 [Portunus trituberculatus]|uniref:Uncharacterized protein n=1 Tax=Portunus trituberculatus TaxID=210409 RepID=A0A5B7JQ75_PORTR|nr:hypothetical protein [Portunus trituberculatus]
MRAVFASRASHEENAEVRVGKGADVLRRQATLTNRAITSDDPRNTTKPRTVTHEDASTKVTRT